MSAAARVQLLRTAVERQQQRGGSAGAEFLFGSDGLHPYFWGVTKPQVEKFAEEVLAAQAAGAVVNYTPAGVPAITSR